MHIQDTYTCLLLTPQTCLTTLPSCVIASCLTTLKPVESGFMQGKGRGFDMWKATCWARTYWHRLLGTAASWFVWDFAFYGAHRGMTDDVGPRGSRLHNSCDARHSSDPLHNLLSLHLIS